MLSRITTVAFQGIQAVPVDVQVQIANGLPAFNIVGLADKTVAESRERIRSALTSIGLSLPPKRITVNLSPADMQKEGSHFDLPIAVGLLVAMNLVPASEINKYLILGELALDGRIMPVAGILPAAIGANSRNKGIICPEINGKEASWSGNPDILPISSLLAIINHFKGIELISPPSPSDFETEYEINNEIDISDIKGQELAKRALEIAAAGGHNLLMYGAPGTGKSMLASRLPTILPQMDSSEILECSMISSVAGDISNGKLTYTRPFRSPHHSCSMAAMVGGGRDKKIKPGEISLAHNGVLFLDELPEFPRTVLDSLRQPLEEGKIHISRADAHITYPANFQLIAAMNPCRCGYLLEAAKACNKAPRCSDDYVNKISGPLLDRFDLYIEVGTYSPMELRNIKPSETSKDIAQRVKLARNIQIERYKNSGIRINNELYGKLLNQFAPLSEECLNLLDLAAEKWNLSMRGYNRIIKVARTIADLSGEIDINKYHLSEAINYRQGLKF